MSNKELELKLKIGEIEFYAKGEYDDVEAQRQIFTNVILPAAVNAIKNAKTSQAIIEEKQMPVLPSADEITAADNPAVLNTMSVNEFINSKGFKTQINQAIGLIYYHEKLKSCQNFKSEDLKHYFKEAKIPVPQNLSLIINRLVGKAYLMNADDKKSYCLTQNGIRFIEEYSPKEMKDKKSGISKPRKPRAKIESSYSHLSADDLNLKNYPDIKSFKTFKEKMMIVLYIVKEEGHGDTFSVYDVQVLMTDVLGHKATKGQLQGVFDRNATWFTNVIDPKNKKIVKHKLLNDGIDYARKLISNINN